MDRRANNDTIADGVSRSAFIVGEMKMSKAAEVRRLRAEGKTIDQICEAVQLSRHEILKVCRLAGMAVTLEEKEAAKKRQAAEFAHSEAWATDYIRRKTGGRMVYISGYVNMDSPVKVLIVRTGQTEVRNMKTFRGQKTGKYKRRAATGAAGVIDRDITLQKLFERDGGVCYLCGRPCDFNDVEIRDGVPIYGHDYPSIDHVVPASRGGLHSWKNVKLSHIVCNIKKRDAIKTSQ